MQKVCPNLFEVAPPRRRSRTPAAIVILMGLLLSPLVVEATQLGTAQWKGMVGNVPHVEAPMLNSLAYGLRAAGDEIRVTLSPILRHHSWNPRYVVLFGLGWASIAILMLRR